MAKDKLIYGTEQKPVNVLEEFTKYADEARKIKEAEAAEVIAKKKERWTDVLKYDTANMSEAQFFNEFRMRAPQKVKNLLYTTIAKLALLYPNTNQPTTINEVKALINQASLEGKLTGDILGNAVTLTKALDTAQASTTIGIESPILNVSGDIDQDRYDISKNLKLGNIDLKYQTTFDEGKQVGSTYDLNVPFDIKALEGSVGLKRTENKYNTSNLLNLDSTYESGNLNVGLTGSAEQDKSGIATELRPSFKYKVPTDYGTLSALASKDIVEGGDANALLSYTYGDTGHPSDEDEFFRISAEWDPIEGDKKAFVGFKTKFQDGGLAELPSIPAPTGIDNLDEEVVEQEVTWRDFPAPGTIFQRDLTDRETTAVKNFGQGLVNFQKQLSLDLIPGLGEQRMAGYGTEEVQLMIEAAKRKDVPGTIAHGVGVPIMAAGTFPWWFGVPGKWLARGYRAATAPFRKKAKYFDQAATTMMGTGHVAMVNRALNTPQKRVAYEQWLKGLPEYRSVADQTMVRRNIEEFLQLPPERIQLLDIEGRAEAATAARLPPAGGPDTIEGIVAENKRLVKEQTTHHQVGVKDKTEMLQSGSVPTRITEKFSLGESLAPVRTGAQATTSEFLGSHAYDVIGMANFNQMPVKNMMEYLAGMVRSGKLKKEELFDAGLLKLDAANKPVGGTLFDLSANTPNMVIGKQDVLKILKESPAENLKIQTYRSATVDPAVYYDLYASTSMMGNTMDNFLQKTIFATKNTASRSKLRQVQKDVAALDKSMFDTANHLSFENSNFRNEFFFPMMERMDALMPSLDSGTQQVLRAYMENAKKINRMSNDIQVTKTGPVQAFKSSGGAHSGHESSTMEGGFGYSEKVIYLDETIPFNRDKGRIRFTSHFPQDNPIVHSRYKTRYDRSGNQITAIEEIQSDTLQPFWDTGAKTKRETMLSPFGNQLTEAYVRRRLVELNKQMEPFLPKNLKKEVAPGQWVKRSMTDKELKNLQKIDAEKAELRNFLTKRDFQIEGQATQAVQPGVRGTTEKVDFFPYMRRTGGVPGYDVLMIKAMLDDAIRTGKKGITIVPAGVGDRSTDAGMYLFYGDTKGTKLKGLEKKAITKKGKKKISPDAIYIDALKVVAKQIEKEHGIKLKVVQREIYNYNPMNMFGIENKSGNIIASFKTRQNRDFILNQKNQASPSKEGFKGVNFSKDAPGLPTDVHRIPSGSFKALVLEIPDSAAKILSKKKLSTYRHGGLVAITPKREYFAPVI